jgi:hypothetical protein
MVERHGMEGGKKGEEQSPGQTGKMPLFFRQAGLFHAIRNP